MAFTNAQLQARHRDRVRVRLTLAALVEDFREKVERQVEEAGGDPASPGARGEAFARMMADSEGRAVVKAFLDRAVGCDEGKVMAV